MIVAWLGNELAHVERAEELEIAARRADGTLRPWTPIWVVCVGGQAYVRTWHRRDVGWFGCVLNPRHARIRVPGLERDVGVEDVGGVSTDLRAAIDASYSLKYGHYGTATIDQMTTDDAAAATLRLVCHVV